MKSLKALTDHLRSLQLINDDSFDSWVENGRLEPSNSLYTCGVEPTQILYRIVYQGVFSWERWHGGGGKNAYFLFAVILQWLTLHDFDFDKTNGFPTLDVEFLDDDYVDVEIKIQFEDKIYGLPDVDGALPVVIPEPVPSVVDDFVVGAA